jgi:hypothetical protein
MKLEQLVARANELINKGSHLLGTGHNQVVERRGIISHIGSAIIDNSKFADFRTSSLLFLARVFDD